MNEKRESSLKADLTYRVESDGEEVKFGVWIPNK